MTPQVDAASDRGASKTAQGAAALRAAHMILDDAPHILSDHLALSLLDTPARVAIRERPARFRTQVSRVLRCDVVVRSRFAEDRLAEAVGRGVHQAVMLGAGLDTFAYRQPQWAAGLRIVEVDHRASQLDKLARLERAGIEPPPNLRYAAADLEADSLGSALVEAGLDLTRPTFVACLGVLIYMSQDATNSMLTAAGRLAPGSEFVFSFSRPDASTVDRPLPGSAAARVAAVGEPWRTRFDPEVMRANLTKSGFGSVRFLFADDIAERYLVDRKDGLRPSPRGILAEALV